MAALDLWAKQHYQRFNVRKCGIMVTARPGFVEELMAIPEDQRWWRLGGQLVPVVETYKHPGTLFPASLDLAVAAKARFAKRAAPAGARHPRALEAMQYTGSFARDGLSSALRVGK